MIRPPAIRPRGSQRLTERLEAFFDDAIVARTIVIVGAAQRVVWAAPWVPVLLVAGAYRGWRRQSKADRFCWALISAVTLYMLAQIFRRWWWQQ